MSPRWAAAARAASRASMRLGSWMLDRLAPPQCLLSEAPVSAPGLISAGVWAQLAFIAPPVCARCGAPFEAAPPPGIAAPRCALCVVAPDGELRARAALVYDAQSRPLVLDLKHGGRIDGLETFARWMAAAGADVLATAEVLAPVPLHPAKLRARRFNQSYLLAAALCRVSGLAVDAASLRRVRHTQSQAGLSPRGRLRNVAGAFAVDPRRRAAVSGRRFVLVDDVYTTGATLRAAARALVRGGAARVDVITLARVVRPSDIG